MRAKQLRYVQAIVFIAISLCLVGVLTSALSLVGSAFHTMASGEGERFLHAIRSAQRGVGGLSESALASIIKRNHAAGLRCIAMLKHRWRVADHAGDCAEGEHEMEVLARASPPGRLVDLGERQVLVHHLPRRPPPLLLGPPPLPAREQDFLIEFVPVQAVNLRKAARRSLAAGLAATFTLLVAVVVFWRMSSRSEQLQEAMERDRLLASLGEMSAVLVHEIRNPLASLKGHAQLLLERLPADGGARERAAWVVLEAVRLERLCDDLLSLFRSNRLDRTDVDPGAVLREAVEAVGEGRVEIDTHEAPSRWTLDPLRMHQVLTNLLRNALQATRAGQTVQASAGKQNSALLFSVRDFGDGVPRGEEEHIFEPFRTTKTRGTGLGLAVARRIVEMHGGSITVHRPAGGGADFRVVIPPIAGI